MPSLQRLVTATVVGVSGRRGDGLAAVVMVTAAAVAYAGFVFAWDRPRSVAGDELDFLFWGSLAVLVTFAVGGLVAGRLASAPGFLAVVVVATSLGFAVAITASQSGSLAALAFAFAFGSGASAAVAGHALRARHPVG